MRVVVLGAGVVGVATAHYLAIDGHEVVVVDREGVVGRDASAGNAGLIAPGHSYAWASPAAPRMMVRSLLGQRTAIRVKPTLDPALIGWGLRFLRECTTDRARRNTLVKHRLCRHSHDCIKALAASESIEYARESAGVFYLYGDEAALQIGWAKTALLRGNGEDLRLLTPAEVLAREPALAAATSPIAGAIFGADDASGDCELFTQGLAASIERRGVTFQLGETINGLRVEDGAVAGVRTTNGEVRGDAYVLALGTGSAAVARTAGIRVPVYPAKGYSATFPVLDSDACPRVGGVDEETLVAWSRLGDRLRMSSTAEFSGYDRSWRPDDFAGILATARRLFPGAADWDAGAFRACLRPMTPDGPPVVGRSRIGNLWLNTGHGHMGWTMGPGSGQVFADLFAGRAPVVDATALGSR